MEVLSALLELMAEMGLEPATFQLQASSNDRQNIYSLLGNGSIVLLGG